MGNNTSKRADAVVQFDGKNVTWKTPEQVERDREFLARPSPCPHCGALVEAALQDPEQESNEAAAPTEHATPVEAGGCPSCRQSLGTPMEKPTKP